MRCVLPRTPGRQRHAHRHGQAVSERAGRELDARHVVADVAHQPARVAVVALEPLLREESQFAQHGVDGAAAVALAQDEPVAVGPVGDSAGRRAGRACTAPPGSRPSTACCPRGRSCPRCVMRRQCSRTVRASRLQSTAQSAAGSGAVLVLFIAGRIGESWRFQKHSRVAEIRKKIAVIRSSDHPAQGVHDIVHLRHDGVLQRLGERDRQIAAAEH